MHVTLHILFKIFTYIFLPPGIFIFILFLAGFFSKRYKTLFFFQKKHIAKDIKKLA